MTTLRSRFASVPFTAAFAIALALPLAALARPANTRPTVPSQVDRKNAKDPTTDVALPARRSCRATDDSEYAHDAAGGPVTEDASTGIEVGIADPGDGEIVVEDAGNLEISDEEAAVYLAAVAAYEKHNSEMGSCDEGDADATTDE